MAFVVMGFCVRTFIVVTFVAFQTIAYFIYNGHVYRYKFTTIDYNISPVLFSLPREIDRNENKASGLPNTIFEKFLGVRSTVCKLYLEIGGKYLEFP